MPFENAITTFKKSNPSDVKAEKSSSVEDDFAEFDDEEFDGVASSIRHDHHHPSVAPEPPHGEKRFN